MYGIFTNIWVILWLNVGKYTIHGAYRLVILLVMLTEDILRQKPFHATSHKQSFTILLFFDNVKPWTASVPFELEFANWNLAGNYTVTQLHAQNNSAQSYLLIITTSSCLKPQCLEFTHPFFVSTCDVSTCLNWYGKSRSSQEVPSKTRKVGLLPAVVPAGRSISYHFWSLESFILLDFDELEFWFLYIDSRKDKKRCEMSVRTLTPYLFVNALAKYDVSQDRVVLNDQNSTQPEPALSMMLLISDSAAVKLP